MVFNRKGLDAQESDDGNKKLDVTATQPLKFEVLASQNQWLVFLIMLFWMSKTPCHTRRHFRESEDATAVPNFDVPAHSVTGELDVIDFDEYKHCRLGRHFRESEDATAMCNFDVPAHSVTGELDVIGFS